MHLHVRKSHSQPLPHLHAVYIHYFKRRRSRGSDRPN